MVIRVWRAWSLGYGGRGHRVRRCGHSVEGVVIGWSVQITGYGGCGHRVEGVVTGALPSPRRCLLYNSMDTPTPRTRATIRPHPHTTTATITAVEV